MYRTVSTDTWSDPWFSYLPPDGKYLFLYLLTSERTNAAGCYEVAPRQIAFETGLPIERIEALLTGDLASRVVWWPKHRIVFIRNFFHRQWGGARSWQRESSARKSIAGLPSEVRDMVSVVYPWIVATPDTPSIPYQDGIDTVGRKESESESESVTESATTSPPTPPAN